MKKQRGGGDNQGLHTLFGFVLILTFVGLLIYWITYMIPTGCWRWCSDERTRTKRIKKIYIIL